MSGRFTELKWIRRNSTTYNGPLRLLRVGKCWYTSWRLMSGSVRQLRLVSSVSLLYKDAVMWNLHQVSGNTVKLPYITINCMWEHVRSIHRINKTHTLHTGSQEQGTYNNDLFPAFRGFHVFVAWSRNPLFLCFFHVFLCWCYNLCCCYYY